MTLTYCHDGQSLLDESRLWILLYGHLKRPPGMQSLNCFRGTAAHTLSLVHILWQLDS
jgi:hypothetical protein